MDNELTKSLHDSLVSLAHKHASVSFLLIGVLAALMLLMGVGGYLAVKHFDKLEAKAEQDDAQYAQDKKALQDQIKDLQTQQNTRIAQSQAIDKQTQTRDTAAKNKIAAVKAPTVTPTEAENEVKQDYHFQGSLYNPTNQMFQFTLSQVQEFNATALERDQLKADLADKQTQLDLEHKNFLDEQSKNQKLEAENKECEKVKNDFKGAAKASKWKRFFGGVGKVALVVGGAVAGYEVAHHL